MKILKVTDVVIQVSMLVFFPVKAILNKYEGVDMILYAYFCVGGYQFTSCLVQFIARYNQRADGSRALYQSMLLWVTVTGIITLPFYMAFLIALLLLSPLMALFYTWLSIRETIKIIGYEK
ncbi:MAG TPA: hypothetical protein VLD19_05705 [Chitinophagaceae bacterium]|nr:hypothetical protein [Chitinophagaceae bacterium]